MSSICTGPVDDVTTLSRTISRSSGVDKIMMQGWDFASLLLAQRYAAELLRGSAISSLETGRSMDLPPEWDAPAAFPWLDFVQARYGKTRSPQLRQVLLRSHRL